jgi:asparagine synthetase B (glutamine-hydrolysing)
MPTLAGWLTGEQVPEETIDQTLITMGEVLGRYGGQPARTVQPGAGLIAFSDPAYANQPQSEPAVLDWVPDRRTLVYRRPLSGAHTLYYVENWPAQGNLLFASEIKALLAVGVPRRLHLAALDALLRYDFIPAPWTAFKDIFVVPAGSILRWQRAKTVVSPSTDFHFDPSPSATDHLEQLASQLTEASRSQLPSHENLVALTGGDTFSALSTLLTTQHTTTNFPVVSIGYKKYSRGWKQAQQVASLCQRPFLGITGVDQPEFWIAAITALEMPTTDTRALALHQLFHTAGTETGARVAISGLGASCLYDMPAPRVNSLPSAESEDIQILHAYAQHGTAAAGRIWSQAVAAQLYQEEPWEMTLTAQRLARQAVKLANQQLSRYYLDLHLRLPDYIVAPMQQMAIQELMVVRSPYLDARIMDTMTRRLPLEHSNGATKATMLVQLLRHFLPDARLPMHPTLPLMAPMASLSTMAENDVLHQTLSTEALQASGLFDPQVVRSLQKQNAGKAGKAQRELLFVFTTQLLCKLFGMEL